MLMSTLFAGGEGKNVARLRKRADRDGRPYAEAGGQRMNITDCHVAARLAMTDFWGKGVCRRRADGEERSCGGHGVRRLMAGRRGRRPLRSVTRNAVGDGGTMRASTPAEGGYCKRATARVARTDGRITCGE